MPSKSKSKDTIKKTEAETLATFQEEIPSIYFSHKEEQEYEKYTKKAEYVYRDHFKFPLSVSSKYENFSSALKDVTSYVENLNKGSKIDLGKFGELSNMLKDSAKNLDPLGPLQKKWKYL